LGSIPVGGVSRRRGGVRGEGEQPRAS
jgi:hypothetical protein